MARKKGNILMYVSPFKRDKKIEDYDGAKLFGESIIPYKEHELIYFLRKPFTQGGDNGKLEAEVQGIILEAPTEETGKNIIWLEEFQRAGEKMLRD